MSNPTETKRGRGRPKGSTGKAPKLRHYTPKKWLPVFDEIILFSIKGSSNKELAVKYGYSAQQISNILSTDQAEEIRTAVSKAIRAAHTTDIAERFAKLQEKALSRVEDLMDADHLFQKAPLEAIDRAFKVLQMAKIGDNPQENRTSVTNIQQNNLMVSSEDFARIQRGALLSSGMDEITQNLLKQKDLNVDYTK